MGRHTPITVAILFALSVGSQPSAALAVEAWDCEYPASQDVPARELFFQAEGKTLHQAEGDTLLDYTIIEDSQAAILAVIGGAWDSGPRVQLFGVMIDKDTGKSALIDADIDGSANAKPAGHCRRTGSK